MENTIALQNAHRLASLSVAFCAINGLEVTAELVPVLSHTILSECAAWCAENGQEFAPEKILIPDEAISYAFDRCQAIASLANLAVFAAGMES